MKTLTLLAAVIATTAVTVQSTTVFYDRTCQTSAGSASATDLNNVGIALQQPPQSTTNYCSGGSEGWNPIIDDPNRRGLKVCGTAATWNSAAVNICTQTGFDFCLLGGDLGQQVQNLALTCRNGNNLSGGKIYALGSDRNAGTVELFHA